MISEDVEKCKWDGYLQGVDGAIRGAHETLSFFRLKEPNNIVPQRSAITIREVMLETKRVRFDVSQQALELRCIDRVTDPSEGLASKITSAIHIRAPRFPSLIKASIRGVRAEDEQESKHGRRERERQSVDFENGEPGGESTSLSLHAVVDYGHEDC